MPLESSEKSTNPDQSRKEADRLFLSGLSCHNNGDLEQAGEYYRQALKLCESHHDALHLSGVIASQTGDPLKAKELISKAIEINPRNSAAHVNLGSVLEKLGQTDAALRCYDTALALKPTDAQAHYLRGNALRGLKKFEAAVESYVEAIERKPDYANAYWGCGIALRDLGQMETSLQCCDKAIELGAGGADLFNIRGTILSELGRFDEALASYLRAIELEPRHAPACYNCGAAYKDLGKYGSAMLYFDKAIALNPDYAEAYNNRGLVLTELKQFDLALASYDKAIMANPGLALVHVNRGVVLQKCGRMPEAMEAYDSAISIDPGCPEAFYNRATLLGELRRFNEAVECYDKAIALRKDYAKALCNKSLVHLALGDYEVGWRLFEWRWTRDALARNKRSFSQSTWLGDEPLQNKTILLSHEQGLGDTLQFCRYARLVADLGAKVILEARKPLVALLEGLDGVSQVVEEGKDLPEFDYQCPLMSLPLAFKTTLETIPARIPYLRADPDKVAYWKQKLGPRTRPRVGLVWNGGFRKDQPEVAEVNERRNVPLSEIVALNIPGIDFFSLQKGEPAESELLENKQSCWPEDNFFNFADELRDFTDTAALVENLDLVISVDTSTAHLAAAMGKPVWLLNRYDSCWRWLLNRTDSPWYPTIRIYRQETPRDWATVLVKVRNDLAAGIGDSLEGTNSACNVQSADRNSVLSV